MAHSGKSLVKEKKKTQPLTTDEDLNDNEDSMCPNAPSFAVGEAQDHSRHDNNTLTPSQRLPVDEIGLLHLGSWCDENPYEAVQNQLL